MTVDEIVAAIKALDEDDRCRLLAELIKIDDLMEDLEDIVDILRSDHGSERPYDEFLAELRAEGRDV